MFKLSTLGLALACLITAAAVFGAALLIALDFAGTDGLARAWSGLSGVAAAHAAETPLADRLKGVGEIDLFTTADVPGSTVRVHTGTGYANAQDLAGGRVAKRWCYADRDAAATSFQPTIVLGNQQGAQDPVLLTAANVSAEEARQLGVTPAALADLARRLCGFGH